jgi:hypothetical protein
MPATMVKLFYDGYLMQMGDKLDCHYTIERVADTSVFTSPLTTNAEIEFEDVVSIEDLVTKLASDFPTVTVERDSVNPSIIHLIETSLRTDANYVIDQSVTITFAGTLQDLVEHLESEVGRLGGVRQGVLPAFVGDYVTTTTVDVADTSIRRLLTDAVPLEGYSRVIWVATTSFDEAEPYTETLFWGAASEEE